MKNIQYTIGFIALIILTGCSSCKKTANPPPDNPYGLPNATQTGANIFACLINGTPWIFRGGGYAILNAKVRDTAFSIGAYDSTTTIIYVLSVPSTNKIYRLNDTTKVYGLRTVEKSCFQNYINGYGNIVPIKSYDGEVHLTKVDSVNKIISGTFWFHIKTDYCDTIKISNGRFDCQFH
ncbi:DUF6252 family protein [Hydrotalea sp.]|uniref:DUF6252 family protein n=1 Tax=Hydrotalea sp. TaxID=2881279 RepID=UPI0026344AE6|nr:DUF6252 family protein [Hydrotalea sp.]